MKAYIKGYTGNFAEVEVKWRTVDSSGLCHIEDTSGVMYETHLSNVIFVDAK